MRRAAHGAAWSALLATLCGLPGCDQPAACGPDGACPTQLTCVDGFCRNTLGVQVNPADAATADSSCPSASPLGLRAFAASTPVVGGLAIVGGEPVADACHDSVPQALGTNAVIAGCGGFAPLPPLPLMTNGSASRVGAMAARNPVDGSLWHLGGRNGAADAAPSGEVWRLPAGASSWTVATAAVTPRSHGALMATTSPKALWLYGGDIGPGGTPIATDELRRLGAATTTWQLAIAGGELPGARRNFASTSLGDRLAIYGGADAGDNVLGDVHLLHAASLVWKRVAVIGPGPAPRVDAAITALGSNQLLLFGGDEADWGPRNDLWRLDLQIGSWTRLRVGDLGADGRTDSPLAAVPNACAPPVTWFVPSAQDPEARAGGALARIESGDILLYGGLGRCGALADLWRLDAGNASWARIRSGGGGLCPLRADACPHLCAGATP